MGANRISHSGGHFELAIDGHKTSAFLKSVDGGTVRANPIDEPVGPSNQRIKHQSTVQIEPFTLELGMSGAGEILTWIRESWNNNPTRRNGQITHANFDLKTTYEHEFTEALITEATFPELDGASKQSAYLKLKLQPERVESRKVDKETRVAGNMSEKQKMWVPSAYRLTIDGVDGMEYTNKLEAFTIKQTVQMFYTGQDRFPEITPTKIEFPNLVGTVSLAHAGALLKWNEDYVVKGLGDSKAQKSGMLEYLAPNKKDVIFTIQFYEIGIKGIYLEAAKANQDSVKRVKFDLFVGRMDMTGSGMGIA